MSNVKFKYFGDTSKAYTNVITVASELTIEKDNNDSFYYYINFNFAFCNNSNKKEDKYNKSVGRDLALSRLKENPHKINLCRVIVKGDNDKYKVIKPTYKEIDDVILEYILKEIGNIPPWYYKWYRTYTQYRK